MWQVRSENWTFQYARVVQQMDVKWRFCFKKVSLGVTYRVLTNHLTTCYEHHHLLRVLATSITSINCHHYEYPHKQKVFRKLIFSGVQPGKNMNLQPNNQCKPRSASARCQLPGARAFTSLTSDFSHMFPNLSIIDWLRSPRTQFYTFCSRPQPDSRQLWTGVCWIPNFGFH